MRRQPRLRHYLGAARNAGPRDARLPGPAARRMTRRSPGVAGAWARKDGTRQTASRATAAAVDGRARASGVSAGARAGGVPPGGCQIGLCPVLHCPIRRCSAGRSRDARGDWYAGTDWHHALALSRVPGRPVAAAARPGESGRPACAALQKSLLMAMTAWSAACRIEAAMLARYPAWQCTQIGLAGGSWRRSGR